MGSFSSGSLSGSRPFLEGRLEAPEAGVIALFLKAPRPGSVKTRLAREIGEAEAARIFRRLVERQLAAIPRGWHVELHFAPGDDLARQELEAWLGLSPGAFFPQVDGGLGERLVAGLRGAHSRHPDKPVFAIGGDCPGLEDVTLRAAAKALEEQSLVLGPALDGGYYLIGAHRLYPRLFQGIDWSTARVLRQTQERADELGLRSHLLLPLADVDDLASLRAHAPELARTCQIA